jgi:peptidoglycan/LPS O-acetylase OafA/YrhL
MRSRHPNTSARSAAIDWAKGLAIIGVLLIHAHPLAGTFVQDHVIDRSVFVFITLLGTTSELWWQKHGGRDWVASTRRWYGARLRRLMVPVWGTLAALWAFRMAVGVGLVAPVRVMMTFAGYMPWIGTGWFVTLALELVILLPFLRATVDALGPAVSLLLSAAVLVACHMYEHDVIALMRFLLHDRGPQMGFSYFYFFWIFPPTRFFLVVVGLLIARGHLSPSPRGGAIAATVVVLGGVLADRLAPHSVTQLTVMAVLDVPLTIAILSGVQILRVAPRAGSILAWYGQHSWGVYLGQLLVHEATYAFVRPAEGPLVVRWVYFLVLLASGTVLVPVGERLRTGITDLGRTRSPMA